MLLLSERPTSSSSAGAEVTFSREGCGNAGYAGGERTMSAKATHADGGTMPACRSVKIAKALYNVTVTYN